MKVTFAKDDLHPTLIRCANRAAYEKAKDFVREVCWVKQSSEGIENGRYGASFIVHHGASVTGEREVRVIGPLAQPAKG